MKARLILITVLTALCGNAFAQDIIHTLDGRSIEAKILEISEEDILYKAFDNVDGPDYRMSVNRIARIVFENGKEQVFAPATLFSQNPYVYDFYGPLEYRRGHFYDHRGRLYEEQLRDYLGVSLYGSDYLKARNQLGGGICLTFSGAGILAASVIGGAFQADFNARTARMRANSAFFGHESPYSSSGEMTLYIVGGIVGAACLGVGIPLWVKGNKKMNAIADDYNRRYGNKAYGSTATLNLGATGNGVGLALKF